MSRQTLEICLGETGIRIATLLHESHGAREHSSFQYTDEWLNHPLKFAVAPSLPLDDSRRYFSGATPLPAPLMDTLPDSWGRKVLLKYSRAASLKAPFDTLAFLVSVDDFSRIGALRVRAEGKNLPFLAPADDKEMGIPSVQHLRALGEAVFSVENETPEISTLRMLRYLSGSLGGARPKCSILNSQGKLALAKFTSKEDKYAVEKAEALTLHLAKQCGIVTPNVELVTEAKVQAAIIERFDRRHGKRIPYISAQTMLNAPTADAGTYVDIADSIREHSLSPQNDLVALFQRIAFTILVSNVDDHLKNHGFLYAGQGRWRLSPIFDVNPMPERHRILKTPIAEPSEPIASIELLMENAFYFEVNADCAARIVSSTAQTIAQKWEIIAVTIGMTPQEIKEYRPAFEHDEARVAQQLLTRK
jgi:serine/threonine-protein kinase HipA